MKFLGGILANYVKVGNYKISSLKQTGDYTLTLSGNVMTTTSATDFTNCVFTNCTIDGDNFSQILGLSFTPSATIKSIITTLTNETTTYNYQNIAIEDIPNITSDLQTYINNNNNFHTQILDEISNKGGISLNAQLRHVSSNTDLSSSQNFCFCHINGSYATTATTAGIYCLRNGAFNNNQIGSNRTALFSVSNNNTTKLIESPLQAEQKTEATFIVLYNKTGNLSLTFKRVYLIYNDINSDVTLTLTGTNHYITVINYTSFNINVVVGTSIEIIGSLASKDIFINNGTMFRTFNKRIATVDAATQFEYQFEAGEAIQKGDYVYIDGNKVYKSIKTLSGPSYSQLKVPVIEQENSLDFIATNKNSAVVSYRLNPDGTLDNSLTLYFYNNGFRLHDRKNYNDTTITSVSLYSQNSFFACADRRTATYRYDQRNDSFFIGWISSASILHIRQFSVNPSDFTYTQVSDFDIYVGPYLSVGSNSAQDVYLSLSNYLAIGSYEVMLVAYYNDGSATNVRATRIILDTLSNSYSITDSDTSGYISESKLYVMDPMVCHVNASPWLDRHEFKQFAFAVVSPSLTRFYYLRNQTLYHVPFERTFVRTDPLLDVNFVTRLPVSLYNMGLSDGQVIAARDTTGKYSIGLGFHKHSVLPVGDYPNYIVFPGRLIAYDFYLSYRRTDWVDLFTQGYIPTTLHSDESTKKYITNNDYSYFLATFTKTYCGCNTRLLYEHQNSTIKTRPLFLPYPTEPNPAARVPHKFVTPALWCTRDEIVNGNYLHAVLSANSASASTTRRLMAVAKSNASQGDTVTVTFDNVLNASDFEITGDDVFFYDSIREPITQNISTPTAYCRDGKIVILKRSP